MKKKYLILMAVSGLILALDQLTKMYIHSQFQVGDYVVIVKDYFNITYVRNYGAAFGFLAESHPSFREIFFLSMPPLALFIILLILRGVEERDWYQITALSLVFGGAVGNYVDRLRFRFVVDFLDFHYKNHYSWPSFNIADSAIVCGVAILILLMLREKKNLGNQHPSESEVT